MTSIQKKKDLLDFINSEICNNEVININKAFKLFNKCLCKSIIECYNKFYSIENIDIIYAVNACSNIVYHVYWSLLSYTNNIKLTIFLSERAVLLYTEFITMSQNPLLNSELKFVPNINDAIIFSYKKTIGPLIIDKNKIKNDSKFNYTKNAALDIKLITQKIIELVHNDNTIIGCSIKEDNTMFNNSLNLLFDNIVLCISKNIYDIYTKCLIDNNNYLFGKIYDILCISKNNILNNIFIIKILLETFMQLYQNCPDYNKSIKCIEDTYSYFYKNNLFDNNQKFTIDNFHKNIKKKKIYSEFKDYAKKL